MIKILTIFALTIILATPAIASNVTTVESHENAFDMNSTTYNTSLRYHNYTVFTEEGKEVDGGLEYNSITGTITQNNTGNSYYQGTGSIYATVDWFGNVYVALNGKANKLSRLLINQDVNESKILARDENWELGEGFKLHVEGTDIKTKPRQVWFVLFKDGKTLGEWILNDGEVGTYTAKSLKGESDVPVFVTYVDNIGTSAVPAPCLPGIRTGERCVTAGPDQVQLKYTWLISQNVLEIKPGDTFGVFEVKEANENYVLLYNKDKIKLDQNTIQDTPKAESNIAGATATATSVKTTPTTTPAPKQPGFEALYAIAGLITAAYFVHKKKY